MRRSSRPSRSFRLSAYSLLIVNIGVLSTESLRAEPEKITIDGRTPQAELSRERVDDLKELLLEQQRAIEALKQEVQHLREVVETLKKGTGPTPADVDSGQDKSPQSTLSAKPASNTKPDDHQNSQAPSLSATSSATTLSPATPSPHGSEKGSSSQAPLAPTVCRSALAFNFARRRIGSLPNQNPQARNS